MISKLNNIADLPPDLGPNGTNEFWTEEQKAAFAKQIMDQIVQSASANRPPPPVGRSLVEFFNLVKNAIRSRENSEGTPDDKRILFIAELPTDEIDTEAIVFRLKSRQPGQFSRGSTGAGGTREITYHVRSVQQHPEHPGEKLITMGRRADNYVQFDVYAKNDFTALERTIWFETLIDSFNWYFRLYGINNVLYEGTGDRERIKNGTQTSNRWLTKYSMVFFLQTEETYQFGRQQLRQILLNLDISND